MKYEDYGIDNKDYRALQKVALQIAMKSYFSYSQLEKAFLKAIVECQVNVD